MAKILIATEKPFAPAAVDGIKDIAQKANFEVVLLEKYDSKDQLLSAVADVDAMIIRSDKVTKEVIEAGKNLKIVVRAGAGYDNVDLESATANNVVVMNTPGQNSNAVAELAIGMMVFLARGGFNGKAGSELKGKTIGIHAYGNESLRLRSICKQRSSRKRRSKIHRFSRRTLPYMPVRFTAHSGQRQNKKVYWLRPSKIDAQKRRVG
jgi:D-3-phosphoglycerate dehydrogenase